VHGSLALVHRVLLVDDPALLIDDELSSHATTREAALALERVPVLQLHRVDGAEVVVDVHLAARAGHRHVRRRRPLGDRRTASAGSSSRCSSRRRSRPGGRRRWEQCVDRDRTVVRAGRDVLRTARVPGVGEPPYIPQSPQKVEQRLTWPVSSM
jgi:hypothetical protein